MPAFPGKRPSRGQVSNNANGMDRPRSSPQWLRECVGACQDKEHHHASLQRAAGLYKGPRTDIDPAVAVFGISAQV